ncbi:replication protein A, subunit RPA32 [Xylariaceae sp. FL0804]|nr:replication protein A, subunit RPA32 [Xylariaceae sp. FL0804]
MSAYGGYSTTSYGGGGGDDGGGFMYGSQGGSQSAAKPINDESLRPVTIKQLIEAEPIVSSTDNSFRIDALEVKQVTLVGMVRSILQQTTNVTYRLDDGTGVIEVKQWLDADKQHADDAAGGAASSFAEGQYVRVWGRLKAFGQNNKRHVGAHVIKPVKDFNEVNYHLLEATYVHLYFTRGAPSAANGGGGGGGDSMFVDGGGGGGGGGGADAAMDAKVRGYSGPAKKMFNYLNNAVANEGVNIHMIAKDLSMSVQDAMAAAEDLLSQGAIYTTMDDETFAILDGY